MLDFPTPLSPGMRRRGTEKDDFEEWELFFVKVGFLIHAFLDFLSKLL